MAVARPLVVVLAAAFAIAGAKPAFAATPTVVLRPTSMGSQFAYTSAEVAPYAGTRVVVHYVTSGPAAPPLVDANGNGVPDYVEAVAAAADKALVYYQASGFKAPLPDRAGPDTKPDIYVDTLPQGVYGYTLTQPHAEGGTFVLVSPSLDVASLRPRGSVSVTLAHELFHVLQFSYVVSDKIPLWAAEGSASAMSMRVFPQVEDLAMTEYLDAWLKQPWLPLYDERGGCAHCYGGAWWWLYLERLSPKILPRYLAALGADEKRGVSTRVGISQLDKTLRATRGASLFDVFNRFSLDLYRRGLPVGDAYSLKTATRPRTTNVKSVFGLSTHYVPIRVPARARGIVVSVPYGAGPRVSVTLLLGGPKGRVLKANPYRPGKGFMVSALFRNAVERRRIVLVVTSGSSDGTAYKVHTVAVGRDGHLPGWVAFDGG
jgi:hypothetical protein